MDCPRCGSTLAEDQGLCPQCGAATLSNESPAASLPVEPAEVVPVELPPFFAVSLWKFAVMSVCTLGLYELYWFYRNWQRVRVREQKGLSPAVRALFALIFCYPCFRRIGRYGVGIGLPPGPPMLVLALLWMIVELSGALPMPGTLISLSGFVLLLPVQAYANRINSEKVPGHDPNARLTLTNWVWIVLGGGLLLLNLMALFLLPNRTSPV